MLNDLEGASRHIGQGVNHYAESNELFDTANQVLNGSVEQVAFVLGSIYKIDTTVLQILARPACLGVPYCAELVDYGVLASDFAVDYGLQGENAATKNLVSTLVLRALLQTDGVGSYLDKGVSHFVGTSGLYQVFGQTIQDPAFQKTLIQLISSAGVQGADQLVQQHLQPAIGRLVSHSPIVQPHH